MIEEIGLKFNVGWRTANCIEQFERYKSEGTVSKLIVDDVLEMLEGVNTYVSEPNEKNLFEYGMETMDKYALIFGKLPDVPTQFDLERLVGKRQGLEKTVDVLHQFKEGKEVRHEDINYSLEFLKGLEGTCLAREERNYMI